MSTNSDKQPYSSHISFNDIERTFAPVDTGGVLSYDDIAAIHYIEKHGTMGRGGIARAFSTSFIDDRRGVFIASEMKIKIELKDGRKILLTFLKTPVKSNTFMYRMLKEQADSVLAKLYEIQPQRETEEQSSDYTGELRQLKRLVEEGVITEEEFQAKKRRILGI